jgi:hypothetical protein
MLQVVEAWLDAINAGDAAAAAAVCHEQIIVTGPRGQGPMPAAALGEWLERSGFSARPTRWFCGGPAGDPAGGHGLAVVELAARWRGSPDDLLVGALFRVTDGRVAEFSRFDNGLGAALAAGGLVEDRDEVTVRA